MAARIVPPIIAELKAERLRRKLSLDKLGAQAGYHGNHIWGIETGKQRASVEMLVDLGQMLGLELKWEKRND